MGRASGKAPENIRSGGTLIGRRGNINFISGATVTDDAANDEVEVIIAVDSPMVPTGSSYETYSRLGANIGNVASLVAQRLHLVAINLPSGLTVSSISFMSLTTAMVAGTTQLFGLYNSSRVLLRGSVDDTSTAWAANTVKTLALTSPFVTTYSGRHFLGILVDAATPPSLAALATSASVLLVAPALAGASDTGVTALPNPAAAMTGVSMAPWAYVS